MLWVRPTATKLLPSALLLLLIPCLSHIREDSPPYLLDSISEIFIDYKNAHKVDSVGIHETKSNLKVSLAQGTLLSVL